MAYDRISFIPIIQVQTQQNLTFEAQDLLQARYINSLKNIQSYTTHVITLAQECRLDLVSVKHYETPDLWWAIAIFNGIENVATEVVVDKVLNIPSLVSIEAALAEANTRQVTKTSTLTLL